MKRTRNYSWVICFMLLFSLGSCIKEEALNMEADIVGVHADEDVILLNPVISNTQVTLYLQPNIHDLTKLNMTFDLTPGASIELLKDSLKMPAGTQDMNKVIVDELLKNGVYYKVTSEDHQFTKNYLIKIVKTDGGFVPTEYGFEDTAIDKDDKYTIFYNKIDGQDFYNWASGNPSFSLTLSLGGGTKEPESYPTKTSSDAHSGSKAALLETKLTGAFGAMFKKPIAAGNLFIGAFDTGPVLTDPLSATQFGLPFNQIPLVLEGYYKYSPGANVTDENMKPVNTKDSCDIYAVFYNRKQLMDSEPDPKKKVSYLTGHNILKDPSIVAIARLENGGATATNGFVKFTLPFKYTAKVNDADVANLDYSIAIVMSSSKYGDNFIGAVGSKLTVDDLKIVTKK
ncbi:PCMD domain-containing protein [Sphingobacterium siyangense]